MCARACSQLSESVARSHARALPTHDSRASRMMGPWIAAVRLGPDVVGCTAILYDTLTGAIEQRQEAEGVRAARLCVSAALSQCSTNGVATQIDPRATTYVPTTEQRPRAARVASAASKRSAHNASQCTRCTALRHVAIRRSASQPDARRQQTRGMPVGWVAVARVPAARPECPRTRTRQIRRCAIRAPARACTYMHADA